MTKNTKSDGQFVKVSVTSRPASILTNPKRGRVAEKSVAASDLAQTKSYTFHGKSTVRTSGTPIKVR